MRKSDFKKRLHKIKSYKLKDRWIKFNLVDGVLDHCILFKKGENVHAGKSVIHAFGKYPESPDWINTPKLDDLDFLGSYFYMIKEFCEMTIVPNDKQERSIVSHVRRRGNIKLITLLKILYGKIMVNHVIDSVIRLSTGRTLKKGKKTSRT